MAQNIGINRKTKTDQKTMKQTIKKRKKRQQKQ
jgi:hypothetical protein